VKNSSRPIFPHDADAQAIRDAICKRWPWAKHLSAHGSFYWTQLIGKAAFVDFGVEVVYRIDGKIGSKVLPPP
jgi:hypothetical protein